MEGRHRADLARAGVEREPAAARLGDAVLGRQQRLGRRIAQADQHVGIGELDLALDERQADRGFLRRRRAVAGRPPRHDVGDVDAMCGRARSPPACGRAACRSGRRTAGPRCPRRGPAPRPRTSRAPADCRRRTRAAWRSLAARSPRSARGWRAAHRGSPRSWRPRAPPSRRRPGRRRRARGGPASRSRACTLAARGTAAARWRPASGSAVGAVDLRRRRWRARAKSRPTRPRTGRPAPRRPARRRPPPGRRRAVRGRPCCDRGHGGGSMRSEHA